MNAIVSKLNDGGPFFTYPMVIILFVVLGIFIVALFKPEKAEKLTALITSIGWIVAAWAILGHTIGLITAFDNIGVHGQLAPEYLAEGLKMALLNMIIGAFVFLCARIAIIILQLRHKRQ